FVGGQCGATVIVIRPVRYSGRRSVLATDQGPRCDGRDGRVWSPALSSKAVPLGLFAGWTVRQLRAFWGQTPEEPRRHFRTRSRRRRPLLLSSFPTLSIV